MRSNPRLTHCISVLTIPRTGDLHDIASIAAALKGVYGVFVNTDSWTVSEAQEVFLGIRIFELAKEAGTVRHYVWSSLDNVFKARVTFLLLAASTNEVRTSAKQKGNFNPKYYAEHYTAKSRVADWMRAQESVPAADKLSWSILTTGPYMDMLNMVRTSVHFSLLMKRVRFDIDMDTGPSRAFSGHSSGVMMARLSSQLPWGVATFP